MHSHNVADSRKFAKVEIVKAYYSQKAANTLKEINESGGASDYQSSSQTFI